MTALDEAFAYEIQSLGGTVTNTHYDAHTRTRCRVCGTVNRGVMLHVILASGLVRQGERSSAFTCSKDCTRVFVIEGNLRLG